MLFMPDWYSLLRPPYIYLMLGGIFLSGALASICTGKTYGRYTTFAYRTKEPTQFWGTVVIYALTSFCFIGYFLYKVYGHSH